MAIAPIPFPDSIPRLRVPPRSGRPGTNGQDLMYKKEIDNSRLYKEVDPRSRRRCLGILGMAALVFLVFFFVGWEHFRCVGYGYRIARLKTQYAQLNDWNRRLRLEQALLADPQRIDRLARAELGLATAGTAQVVRLGTDEGAPASEPVVAHNFAPVISKKNRTPREP
jgi:cell division protein FtsL